MTRFLTFFERKNKIALFYLIFFEICISVQRSYVESCTVFVFKNIKKTPVYQGQTQKGKMLIFQKINFSMVCLSKFRK